MFGKMPTKVYLIINLKKYNKEILKPNKAVYLENRKTN